MIVPAEHKNTDSASRETFPVKYARRANRKCPRCNENECRPNQGYCGPCHNTYERKRKAGEREILLALKATPTAITGDGE